ncbi:hypothetical protein MKW98_013481 [Papaver atlanticum]|uniref:VWFA domain-containing protein n=1 Tax=Papaver atlanticum TaxID=357466 RepID=A0AAD4SU24_9MAGN|nr:hypothetical protein MKW98_013481 [Papaver atlanticum]
MQFLLQKLSRTDRLSVVTFNSNANRLCPLHQITENSQTEITAGLKMALKILSGRARNKRRGVAIMLMFDGMEDRSSHATSVPVGNVPVYTYGFGTDCDPKVLSDIAAKSNGGMFSAVPNLDNLSVAFSTSLAGLLNVNAGNYQQTKGSTVVDPVAVTFGTLSDRDTRKVLVKFTLPKVDKRFGVNIYKVIYKYRVAGNDAYKSDERTMNITRKPTSTEAERQEVLDEERRIGAAGAEPAHCMGVQLHPLLLFMVSQGTYDKQWKAFALALEASHESQRATALPGGVAGMFNTPLMDEFIKQDGFFNQDPINYQVPIPEEDKATIVASKPAPPVQEDWRYARFRQVIDLTHNIAGRLREHDPRAAFTGKK